MELGDDIGTDLDDLQVNRGIDRVLVIPGMAFVSIILCVGGWFQVSEAFALGTGEDGSLKELKKIGVVGFVALSNAVAIAAGADAYLQDDSFSKSGATIMNIVEPFVTVVVVVIGSPV